MPEMRHGTVEMVPVEWIMQNTIGSCDGYGIDAQGERSDAWENASVGVDYKAMMHSKALDYQFGAVVSAILKEGFQIPIVLYEKRGGWHHGNGHHRMIAAILLTLSEIPVYWSRDGDYMCEEETGSRDKRLRTMDHREWEGLHNELEDIFYYSV